MTALPRTIGRYQLLLPIGRGGMGLVFLARVVGAGGFERRVAVKVVRPSDDSLLASDLIREARITGMIRHPNVVSVLDVCEEDGEVFVVMDLVEGDSLFGLSYRRDGEGMQAVNVPIGLGCKILADALDGLHAAHEQTHNGAPLELVHRDFSPHNLLVGVDGLTRLSDFGIAKVASNETNTTTGVVKGKFSYMSPEQARGDRLDRRADVWAAAVIGWEILAGRRLYQRGNDASTLLAIVQDDVPDPRDVRADVPRVLAEAVMSGLVRDRRHRCGTAAALAARLREAAEAVGFSVDVGAVARFVRERTGEALAEREALVVATMEAERVRLLAPLEPMATLEMPTLRHLASQSGVASVVDSSVERSSDLSGQASASRKPKGRLAVLPLLVGAVGLGTVIAVGALKFGRAEPELPVPPAANVESIVVSTTTHTSAVVAPEASVSEPFVAAVSAEVSVLTVSPEVSSSSSSTALRPTPWPRPASKPSAKCNAWERCR